MDVDEIKKKLDLSMDVALSGRATLGPVAFLLYRGDQW
jgi:hypothetical protein